MFYQKMLSGVMPYFLSVGNISESGFDAHYHHETEVCFCIKGECEIVCKKQLHTLSQGDFAVIFPVCEHSFPKKDGVDNETMVLEFGHAFLGKYNDFFANQRASVCVIRKADNEENSVYSKLLSCVCETAVLKKQNGVFDELYIRSNLYKIGALLLQILEKTSNAKLSMRKAKNAGNIENAMEIIFNRYAEPLSIETVSTLCSYSKSSFCRVFKNVTGDTFHNVLNRHRIEIACHLLRETPLTIEEISQETGFSDLKSFCRVFRSMMNMSAGEYRKNIQ